MVGERENDKYRTENSTGFLAAGARFVPEFLRRQAHLRHARNTAPSRR
jgi:hypothetical protein